MWLRTIWKTTGAALGVFLLVVLVFIYLDYRDLRYAYQSVVAQTALGVLEGNDATAAGLAAHRTSSNSLAKRLVVGNDHPILTTVAAQAAREITEENLFAISGRGRVDDVIVSSSRGAVAAVYEDAVEFYDLNNGALTGEYQQREGFIAEAAFIANGDALVVRVQDDIGDRSTIKLFALENGEPVETDTFHYDGANGPVISVRELPHTGYLEIALLDTVRLWRPYSTETPIIIGKTSASYIPTRVAIDTGKRRIAAIMKAPTSLYGSDGPSHQVSLFKIENDGFAKLDQSIACAPMLPGQSAGINVFRPVDLLFSPQSDALLVAFSDGVVRSFAPKSIADAAEARHALEAAADTAEENNSADDENEEDDETPSPTDAICTSDAQAANEAWKDAMTLVFGPVGETTQDSTLSRNALKFTRKGRMLIVNGRVNDIEKGTWFGRLAVLGSATGEWMGERYRWNQWDSDPYNSRPGSQVSSLVQTSDAGESGQGASSSDIAPPTIEFAVTSSGKHIVINAESSVQLWRIEEPVIFIAASNPLADEAAMNTSGRRLGGGGLDASFIEGGEDRAPRIVTVRKNAALPGVGASTLVRVFRPDVEGPTWNVRQAPFIFRRNFAARSRALVDADASTDVIAVAMMDLNLDSEYAGRIDVFKAATGERSQSIEIEGSSEKTRFLQSPEDAAHGEEKYYELRDVFQRAFGLSRGSNFANVFFSAPVAIDLDERAEKLAMSDVEGRIWIWDNVAEAPEWVGRFDTNTSESVALRAFLNHFDQDDGDEIFWSSDGNHLFTVGLLRKTDETGVEISARIWRVFKNGELAPELEASSDNVESYSSKSGRFLLIDAQGRPMLGVITDNGAQFNPFWSEDAPPARAAAAALSANGEIAVIATRSGTVEVRDLTSGNGESLSVGQAIGDANIIKLAVSDAMDRVYVKTETGEVFAFSIGSGNLLWSVRDFERVPELFGKAREQLDHDLAHDVLELTANDSLVCVAEHESGAALLRAEDGRLIVNFNADIDRGPRCGAGTAQAYAFDNGALEVWKSAPNTPREAAALLESRLPANSDLVFSHVRSETAESVKRGGKILAALDLLRGRKSRRDESANETDGNDKQ